MIEAFRDPTVITAEVTGQDRRRTAQISVNGFRSSSAPISVYARLRSPFAWSSERLPITSPKQQNGGLRQDLVVALMARNADTLC